MEPVIAVIADHIIDYIIEINTVQMVVNRKVIKERCCKDREEAERIQSQLLNELWNGSLN